MPPLHSQVAYLPRQQMYPSTYMVPGQILPQQFPQQYNYVFTATFICTTTSENKPTVKWIHYYTKY